MFETSDVAFGVGHWEAGRCLICVISVLLFAHIVLLAGGRILLMLR